MVLGAPYSMNRSGEKQVEKVAAQPTWLELGQIREVTLHTRTKGKARKGEIAAKLKVMM